MFFREKTTPSGRVLQLMESYRNAQGSPRQRLVVSLGDARMPLSLRSVVARAVHNHINGRADLFSSTEITGETQYWTDYVVRRIAARPPSSSNTSETTVDGVLLDEIQHETVSELGPELVGVEAWRRLGFDECLAELGFNELQRGDAAVTVINRLVDSVSEHRLDQWLPQTALPELLGEKTLGRTDDHYYRMSDKLLACQASIEGHLRARQNSLFALDRSVLLYDLTNTHFEGMCKRNPKAKHGKNKQGRNDCRQVVIGMVFDGSGFELGHKVFEGNQSDSKSLIEMIESLDQFTGAARRREAHGVDTKPIVILDGGISSRKNLSLLRANGFSYLVNDSRRGRVRYEKEFAQDAGFEPVAGRDKRPEVLVRLIEEDVADGGEEGGEQTERVVLCRSEARGEKERAILSNAESRFLVALSRLQKRVISGRLVDRSKVEQSIGRLLSSHRRIQRYYDIEIVGSQRAENITWQRKEKDFRRCSEFFGCYVLRTDLDTLTHTELWRLYITLTRAEQGFQCLKRDLGLRPNRHQKEDRVDGHIFITVLAYQLMCWICRTLEDNGDRRDWDTIRRVLRTHCYTTIILPTKGRQVYRIRKAAQPEECQKEIYRTLGIDWRNLPTTKTKYHS